MIEQLKTKILTDGFATIDLGNSSFIEDIQSELLLFIEEFTGKKINSNKLESIHHLINPETLNDFRLQCIKRINNNQKFREVLSKRALPYFQQLLGPDLAIQKNLNLVISLPEDLTSQIPLHSDVWTGHSPFELNLWVPFTKTFKTQSMFILPLEKWLERKKESFEDGQTIQHLMKTWENDFIQIEMNPGQALIFWHALPHGNVINREIDSRIAINVRIKNLFAPYGDKGLGDYFIPWTTGIMTELMFKAGMQWE